MKFFYLYINGSFDLHFTYVSFQLPFYNFKHGIYKPCISYLFYSSARSSCPILFCLESDIGPATVEAERAEEAVGPPVELEWKPNDVM